MPAADGQGGPCELNGLASAGYRRHLRPASPACCQIRMDGEPWRLRLLGGRFAETAKFAGNRYSPKKGGRDLGGGRRWGWQHGGGVPAGVERNQAALSRSLWSARGYRDSSTAPPEASGRRVNPQGGISAKGKGVGPPAAAGSEMTACAHTETSKNPPPARRDRGYPGEGFNEAARTWKNSSIDFLAALSTMRWPSAANIPPTWISPA